MSKEQKEAHYPKPMSFSSMVFWTGLFGGIFWGTIGFLSNYLGLTEIPPNAILEPWALGDWKYGWLGTVISIIIMGIISIPAAFIYYGILRKWNGVWVGLAYGLVLFLLVFFVLNPLFPSVKPLPELNRDTIITSVCIYLVYGMFIGYSINYEYQNAKGKDNEVPT